MRSFARMRVKTIKIHCIKNKQFALGCKIIKSVNTFDTDPVALLTSTAKFIKFKFGFVLANINVITKNIRTSLT